MEIQKHISKQSWMDLSWQIRTQLAKDLNVKKSSDVMLQDKIVLTDGRTQADINDAITVETLQEYTKSSSEDIFELFGKAVEKAEYLVYLKEHPEEKEEDEEKSDIPKNFMQLKQYAKAKGIDTSVYKTKKEILEQLNK